MWFSLILVGVATALAFLQAAQFQIRYTMVRVGLALLPSLLLCGAIGTSPQWLVFEWSFYSFPEWLTRLLLPLILGIALYLSLFIVVGLFRWVEWALNTSKLP